MIKRCNGMILAATLVFISLSMLLVSQVAEYLLQGNRLIMGLGLQANLVSIANSQKLYLNSSLSSLINWQLLTELEVENGISNGTPTVDFKLLPSCNNLKHSTWFELPLTNTHLGTHFYLRPFYKQVNDGSPQYILFIVVTCISENNAYLAARTTQVFRFHKEGNITEEYFDSSVQPRSLL